MIKFYMACTMLWWSTEEEDLEVVTMLLIYEFDQTDQKYLHFHKTQLQNMTRVCHIIEFHKGLSMMREQLMMECGATLVIRPSTSAPEDLRMSNANMLTSCFMRNCQLNKLASLPANFVLYSIKCLAVSQQP